MSRSGSKRATRAARFLISTGSLFHLSSLTTVTTTYRVMHSDGAGHTAMRGRIIHNVQLIEYWFCLLALDAAKGVAALDHARAYILNRTMVLDEFTMCTDLRSTYCHTGLLLYFSILHS